MKKIRDAQSQPAYLLNIIVLQIGIKNSKKIFNIKQQARKKICGYYVKLTGKTGLKL